MERADPHGDDFSGCPATAVMKVVERLGTQLGRSGAHADFRDEPRDLAKDVRALCSAGGVYERKEASDAGLEWVNNQSWRHFWRSKTGDSPVDLHDLATSWPVKC